MVNYIARSSLVVLTNNHYLRLSLCVCCCWIVLFAQSGLSQPLKQRNSISDSYKRLLDLNRQVLTHREDLSQIGKALGPRDSERLTVLSLQDSAERIGGYGAHARDVLWLYQSISSAKDRENVREDVRAMLKLIVKFLELEIEAVNREIANADKPGIVSAATDLRNVNREIIKALNGVRL